MAKRGRPRLYASDAARKAAWLLKQRVIDPTSLETCIADLHESARLLRIGGPIVTPRALDMLDQVAGTLAAHLAEYKGRSK